MWDKPEVMLWLADVLNAITAAMVLYALGFVVLHLPVFPIRTVEVQGQVSHLSAQEVSAVLNGGIEGNFFTVDLAGVAEKIHALPWVRKVMVRRIWPGQLRVTVEEHQAIGRWGRDALVDRYGEVFSGRPDGDGELPVLFGPKGTELSVTKAFLRFSALARQADMAVDGVVLTPRHAWQIRFRGGITADLGRDDAEKRLERFLRAWPNIVDRMPETVKHVDLRYRNGFAVRVEEGAAPDRRPPGVP